MKMLTPEELNELRNDIAWLCIPRDCQDDLIRLVDSIVVSFIDQAHGLNGVQLSLSTRANYAFNGDSTRAILRNSKENEVAALDSESVIHDEGPTRQAEP